MPEGNVRIGPTAHYTAQVWAQAGFPGADRFDTWTGRFLYWSLKAAIAAGGPLAPAAVRHFEAYLIARHRGHEQRLRDYQPGYVLEIAAGLSPRGLELARELPHMQYVEADLPHMVAAKRELLSGASLPDNYFLQPLDILSSGAWELPAAANAATNVGRSTLVTTEGLVDYLSQDEKRIAWGNVARFLRSRGGGRYLMEMHTRDLMPGARAIRDGFVFLLGRLVGSDLSGRFFPDVDAGLRALRQVGFDEVAVVDPYSVGLFPADVPRDGNPWVLVEADVLG